MTSPFNRFTVHVLESIRDGFVFLDREMRYTYVNDAAVQLLNKPREELLGRYVWDVFPQPEDSPFRGPVDEAAETGRPTHVEGLNNRRGIWYDCYNYPSEEGLTILFRDITEQKRAEMERAESEARFRMMADAAPVLIWTAGPDKGRTFCNETWLDFTGRTMQEEAGFGWTEGVHPDDYDHCIGIYRRAFDRKEPFAVDYRLRRHDGAYRWVVDHGVPLFSASGEPTGYIGSCLDIHDRRLAEERLVYLAEASEVLASSLDYETTLGHLARLIVPRLADWVGIELVTEEGTAERVATAHIDPEKVAWAQEMRQRFPVDLEAATGLARVIRTGESEFVPAVTEEMLVAAAKDEEHLAYMRKVGFSSAIIVPLKTWERTLGALIMVWSESGNHYTEADLSFAQDLARRAAAAIENTRLYEQTRAAEDRLRALNETLEARVAARTRELEQRNMDLQGFASAASHDLQEPLRKIRTFLSLLQEELHEPDAAALDYLGRVDSAAARMSQFITDLLKLSRVTTRGETFRPTDLNRVVDEVLSVLEVSIAEAGGAVEVGTLCTLDADPTQMRQLFQNLIGNALKFHRKGVPPAVTISRQVTPPSRGAAAEEPLCRILVQDNGIGFEEQYADRLFQPFQRLHGRSEYAGTGMGLAICHRIVERHSGTITARSTPGEGTTFLIELPLHQPVPGNIPV